MFTFNNNKKSFMVSVKINMHQRKMRNCLPLSTGVTIGQSKNEWFTVFDLIFVTFVLIFYCTYFLIQIF